MNLNFKLDLEIDKESKDKIVDWTQNNYKNLDYFVNNGFGRRYCSVDKFDTEITDLVNQIAVEKYTQIGIIGSYVEPTFGHFIGVNTNGGNVHPHTDQNMNNLIHTRINFMLSLPKEGGEPLIHIGEEEHKLKIDEGESWINLAGLWKHTSNIVSGDKPRIVLSLGALVPINTLYLVFHEFFPELKWESKPQVNQMIDLNN